MRKLIGAGLLIISLPTSSPPNAAGAEPLLSSIKGLKNITFSLGTNAAEPSVRLHGREIQRERARLGFLRLGLVQQTVIRGLTVRIQSHQLPWAADLWAFAQTEKWLLNASIRDLEIFGPSGKLLIGAKEASFNSSSSHLELRGVAVTQGTKTIHGPAARLFLDGPDSGRLRLPDKELGIIDLEHSVVPNESAPRKIN